MLPLSATNIQHWAAALQELYKALLNPADQIFALKRRSSHQARLPSGYARLRTRKKDFGSFFAAINGRSLLQFLLDARASFCLTQERTNGKFRNSLQSEKVVLWMVFDNLAASFQPIEVQASPGFRSFDSRSNPARSR
jgi:hypothetical protein